MLQSLLRRLKTEQSHYDSLGDVVKRLLYSYSLYLISYPVMGIFINAYFWRQTNDVSLIAMYNLGFFFALPFGFYLNGLLLKSINILKLYWIGVVLQGLAAFMAIFVPTLNINQVLIYGVVYGIGGGLYWANKNYITLKLTKGKNRLYYNSLESSLDLIIGIVMPILVGWFIVFGEHVNLYTIDIAYKLLMVLALFTLAISGYILQSADIYSEAIEELFVRRPTRYWNLNRLILTIYQFSSGINFFIPTVLVLMFVGTEGVLGTIESGTAVLVAILLYVVGRKAGARHTVKIIFITNLVFLLGLALYNLTFGVIGSIIYSIIYSLTGALTFNLIYTISMEVMDKEKSHGQISSQYALVFDNEIFFNVGRILGMAVFFGLAYFTSQELSLRVTPVIAGLLQFVLLIPLSILVKHVALPSSKT